MITRVLLSILLCLSSSFIIAQEQNTIAVQKNNEAVKYVIKGLTNNSDSVKKAIKLLDEAIEINPSYQKAYENKIQFLMYLHDKENALKVLQQLESFKELNSQQLLYKGMLLELNGYQEESIKTYTQAESSLEKQLNEKPDIVVLMNYITTIYLKDSKKCAFENIMKDMPNTLAMDKDNWLRDYMKMLYSKERSKVVEFLLFK